MKEMNLKDLELVYGGMGFVVRAGQVAGHIASKPPVQGAAVGGASHMGENYLKGEPNTAAGITGAMVGGAIGGGFAKSPWGGTIGNFSGAATEGLITGQSPLRNSSQYDQSGANYDGTDY